MKMQNTILKRLERLEALQKANNNKIPDLIIISSEMGKIRVQETYCKHDSKGKIINGSGVNKILWLDDIAEYKEPEGFKGVCINATDEMYQ